MSWLCDELSKILFWNNWIRSGKWFKEQWFLYMIIYWLEWNSLDNWSLGAFSGILKTLWREYRLLLSDLFIYANVSLICSLIIHWILSKLTVLFSLFFFILCCIMTYSWLLKNFIFLGFNPLTLIVFVVVNHTITYWGCGAIPIRTIENHQRLFLITIIFFIAFWVPQVALPNNTSIATARPGRLIRGSIKCKHSRWFLIKLQRSLMWCLHHFSRIILITRWRGAARWLTERWINCPRW